MFAAMKTTSLSLIVLVFLVSSCRFEHKMVEEIFPDGSTKRECVYRGRGDSKELIKETTYYPNKQKQMEGTYKNMKRDGKWTYWYENGKMWSEGSFLLGKSDGKRTTYFENGKVRYEGMYRQDMRVGKWRFFDETGTLLKEVDYSLPGNQ
jgi:antitoxin component YwqK of YwqJK toxin-antitoxin module